MAGRVEGKVAIITGSTAGIGRDAAILFAREGARVVVVGRSVPNGEETVQMILKAGGEAVFIKTDVSKREDVEAMVKKAVAKFGRLDCAFNNAGVSGPLGVPTAECTEEDWDQVININLKGTWLCMKYEIPAMLKNGSGAIVNASSQSGLVGSARGVPAYVASKHGVIGLTKAAALEYAKKGVRVNAVCPGTVHTPLVDQFTDNDLLIKKYAAKMIPIGRTATTVDVAEAVVWLCSDAASFVTGHALPVDGGYTAQ